MIPVRVTGTQFSMELAVAVTLGSLQTVLPRLGIPSPGASAAVRFDIPAGGTTGSAQFRGRQKDPSRSHYQEARSQQAPSCGCEANRNRGQFFP